MSRRADLPLLLLAWLALMAAGANGADAVTPAPWTAYFSAQADPAPWAQTVRGMNNGSLDVLDGPKPARGERRPRPVNGGEPVIVHDLIVPVAWGLRSAKDAEQVRALVAAFKAGGAEARKRALALQVDALERGYRAGRLYWQVGNEINSVNWRRTLGGANGITGTPIFDDPKMIPLYVEYLFAPTVEVLRGASQRVYGDPAHVKVVLGTLANVRRSSSRAWLDQLLAYRIKGTYAPELAGKRVADLVDIIAVHYGVTADNPPWEAIFDGIEQRWIGAGSGIEGIWGTEEIGGKLARAGAGGATAVRVAASYLSRAARRGLPPTALRCSFFFWQVGARKGADRTGDHGMRLLLDRLGHGRVVDLTRASRLEAEDGIDAYVFAPLDGNGKGRVAIVFGRGGDGGEVRAITLPAGAASHPPRATATLLSAAGAREIAFRAQPVAGGVRWVPVSPLSLQGNETLVLGETR